MTAERSWPHRFRVTTYDQVGNRLTETRPAGTTNYTYDPTTDRLTSSSGPGRTVNRLYAAN